MIMTQTGETLPRRLWGGGKRYTVKHMRGSLVTLFYGAARPKLSVLIIH